MTNDSTEYRVVTWTDRDGVTGTTDAMSRRALGGRSPRGQSAWPHIDVEGA